MARSKEFAASDLKASTLAVMIGEAVNRRSNITQDLAVHLPSVITGLIESARGVWKEKEFPSKDGNVVKRIVYQVSPNPKSVQLFLKYAGYDVADLGNSLLALSKAEETQSGLKAKLQKAKADNLASQTLVNTENAVAFKASLVSEEDVKRAALEVFSALMSFIDSYPVEVMQDVCSSVGSFQAWKALAAINAQRAYGKAVGIDEGDLPQLPSGDLIEEAGDDDDDDEDAAAVSR